ncbi:MAG: hypothetical protein H0X04_00340 [Chthoniobacterales bacterium]|nr:hypothetical protein [Chthoniobacterales bacterium]
MHEAINPTRPEDYVVDPGTGEMRAKPALSRADEMAIANRARFLSPKWKITCPAQIKNAIKRYMGRKEAHNSARNGIIRTLLREEALRAFREDRVVVDGRTATYFAAYFVPDTRTQAKARP